MTPVTGPASLYLVTIALEVFAPIVAAVWAVGKIKSTAEGLRHDIKSLDKTIGKPEATLIRVEDRQIQHAERLSALEANSKGD